MEDNELATKVWVGIIVIGIFIWAVFWPTTTKWDGEGEISMFPAGAVSKNYRLPAQINVTEHNHGWFRHTREYSIQSADWPNGGTAEFDNCTTSDTNLGTCQDQGGKSYRVEVTTIPDRPQSNDEGNY